MLKIFFLSSRNKGLISIQYGCNMICVNLKSLTDCEEKCYHQCHDDTSGNNDSQGLASEINNTNTNLDKSTHLVSLSGASRGVRPLSLVLRGQFLLNYSNNFIHIENTISENIAIFKENICNFFKYL